MNRAAFAGLFVVAAMMGLAQPLAAHRLDEYLQATRISIERDQIVAEMSLTPGEAVAAAVIAEMDADRDGRISEAEGREYMERIVAQLRLEVDGKRKPFALEKYRVPPPEDMRAGEGVIRLRAVAMVERFTGRRHLRYGNSYRSDIGAYLVNALLPADEGIRITGQSRDMWQREFDLDYTVSPDDRHLSAAAIGPALAALALAVVALAVKRVW
ncbi:MAG TPA: hypothetical protein VFY29_14190 [Terriglobia bacterium]|nr:hypothetical protein [Terriglobia bacterium]